MPVDSTFYTGHRSVTSSGSGHNIERLHIDRATDERRTSIPVKIVKVYGGGEAAAPTADVQVMIHQVDGLGKATPHATVYGVPVSRVHSSAGAIISDPQAGDIMMMSVADRDISKLKASGQPSVPDTKRRGSLSDGMLNHAILSGKPTQFVRFKPEGGVRIVDSAGAVIETFTDDKTVTMTPPTGGKVLLGGNGKDGGTYGWVLTDAGTSTIVKAKI